LFFEIARNDNFGVFSMFAVCESMSRSCGFTHIIIYSETLPTIAYNLFFFYVFHRHVNGVFFPPRSLFPERQKKPRFWCHKTNRFRVNMMDNKDNKEIKEDKVAVRRGGPLSLQQLAARRRSTPEKRYILKK